MKTHTNLFGYAGAALLLLSALPASAASSSHAEREATRALNREAAQRAQLSNERSIAVTDAAVQAPAGTPPAAAPTARVQTAATDQAPVTSGMANPAAAPVTLATMINPPPRIASANVLDNSGQAVGAVQKIEVTPTGTPTKVIVALSGKEERTVVLDAAAVRYDPARNEITTQATGEQIRAMASG